MSGLSPNTKNIIVFIIFGICITIALLAVLHNYTTILGLTQDTTQDVSSLENTTIELEKTILLLETKIYILEEQQQFLLQEEYDYFIYSEGEGNNKTYSAKSGSTSKLAEKGTNLRVAFLIAIYNGQKTVLKSGEYDLYESLNFTNVSNIIVDGQGAILNLHGNSITFFGDSYENNRNIQIKNFVIRNGTLKFENCYRATFSNIIFEDGESMVEVINTNKWSEFIKFEDCSWGNFSTGITVKTPKGIDATGSYENMVLDGCSFNLTRDNSVGIMVEKNAEVSNGHWTDTRFWLHANNTQTQTGLHVEGKMTNTILSGVVFESFGKGIIYGVTLGEESTAFSDKGIIFEGNFTGRINNPHGKWMAGLFRDQASITFDNSMINSTTIDRDSFTIDSFGAIINITNIIPSEQVEIKVELNYRDDTSTNITLLKFNENQTYHELSLPDLYKLYPSQNTISYIKFIAETNLSNSETNVSVKVFGTAS